MSSHPKEAVPGGWQERNTEEWVVRAHLWGRNYIRDSFGAAQGGKSQRGATALEGIAQIAGNCSCGYETGGCKKLPLEWLGKSHEVMLNRKIHPGVYQAAVTLIPPLSRVLSIFKIKPVRKWAAALPCPVKGVLVGQWPVFSGHFREVPHSSVTPGCLLSPPVPHFEQLSQGSILG